MVPAQGHLTIDWANMPTYNTIMSVAVGAGLLSLVWFGRSLLHDARTTSADGWALTFGVLGGILTATGLHMTLTWPLAGGGFPFDNIIFGETSLAFGVLLLAAAVYLWRRGVVVLAEPDPLPLLARTARPLSVFVVLLGLSLIAIAAAGIRYQMFAAPPQEPISGSFADHPLVEAIFISGLIALVGLGALAFPGMLGAIERPGHRAGAAGTVVAWTWTLAGLGFGLFGAMNFYTHIGLILNTM
jgi:uncharacterized membrane protein